MGAITRRHGLIVGAALAAGIAAGGVLAIPAVPRPDTAPSVTVTVTVGARTKTVADGERFCVSGGGHSWCRTWTSPDIPGSDGRPHGRSHGGADPGGIVTS